MLCLWDDSARASEGPSHAWCKNVPASVSANLFVSSHAEDARSTCPVVTPQPVRPGLSLLSHLLHIMDDSLFAARHASFVDLFPSPYNPFTDRDRPPSRRVSFVMSRSSSSLNPFELHSPGGRCASILHQSPNLIVAIHSPARATPSLGLARILRTCSIPVKAVPMILSIRRPRLAIA